MTADRGGTAASISRRIYAFRPYNRMQMQLGSEAQIPDGLLAANALLGENSHQGVPTYTHALYQGFGFVISNTALGLKRSLYDEGVQSRYTGKERDAESGLDNFGGRYFGSSVGRFITPDPGWMLATHLENPQSWNLYSYVLNNPLSNVDPDGYDCVYLNDAGTDVDRDKDGIVTGIDTNSNKGDCEGNKGFWVDGTVMHVTVYTNSNDVGLSGQKDDGTLTANSYGHSPVDAQDPDMATFGQQGYTGYVPPGFKMTFDPYPLRFFGTHWCGPGGGGVPVNALDVGCKAHDQCFDAAGISAANNANGGSMNAQQTAAAKACNAALSRVAAQNPGIPGSTSVFEWLKHGDQIWKVTGGRVDGNLAPGTATR